MKKLTIAILMLFSSFSLASAELGVNVGVSGQMGLFAASGTELDKGTHGTTSGTDESTSDSDYLGVGYSSVFIEKTLGSRFLIGLEYVPSDIGTETTSTLRFNNVTPSTSAGTSETYKIQVDFSDLTVAYVGVGLTENSYVRLGKVEVDIVTNEKLGTAGSKYGNGAIDGTLVGIGYNKTFDNNVFVRGEANYMTFQGTSITSANGVNKITLNSLDGVSAALKLGKTF
jgi:hypothetical protein